MHKVQGPAPLAGDLIDPDTVERDYRIPKPTQSVWRCTNRYGWGDMTVRIGRRVMYTRSDIEAWLASRKGVQA